MRTIWKFDLKTVTNQTILMPKGAEILAIQSQFNEPELWALVDPEAEKVPRLFKTFGTGHSLEDDKAGTYIGTYQTDGGNYVFHVFEY